LRDDAGAATSVPIKERFHRLVRLAQRAGIDRGHRPGRGIPAVHAAQARIVPQPRQMLPGRYMEQPLPGPTVRDGPRPTARPR